MRKIKLSFFQSYDRDGTQTEQREFSLQEVSEHFRQIATVRKPHTFSKDDLNIAKAGPCFLAGDCPKRGTVLSRSCLVLDGDTTADSEKLEEATRGYHRVIWQTYKSGLAQVGDSDTWAPYDGAERIRIVLPLDRDIPATEWSPDAIHAAFPASDYLTNDLRRIAYNPATWDTEPSRLTVYSDGDKYYPADSLIGAVPTTLTKPSGTYVDTATVVCTSEDLKRLRERLLRQGGEKNQRLARLVYAIFVGGIIRKKENRNEACRDVCNCLAKELPDCSIESILDLCEPTLAMIQEDGSNETRETFRRFLSTWRGILSAEKERLNFELPVPKTAGVNSLGVVAEAPNEVEASLDPMHVLNASFASYTGNKGAYQLFSVTEDFVCTRLDDIDSMITDVMDKARGEAKDGGEITFSAKQARTFIDNWKGTGRKLPEDPIPARFKSDPGYCYKRLTFDPIPGPTPAWDEFCSRLSNADYFKAFIWTAFEPRNRGRQILWMTGNGQDGKSTVMSAISKALGTSACATNVSIFESKHGTSMLEGKRLVYVPDCKDSRLLMNARVREATSGDESVIEPKGKTPYSKALNLKMIVFSNQLPSVSSQQADISRILPMKVFASKNTDDARWQDKLEEQLRFFLWDCRETYNRICAHHGNFKLDDATRDMIDDFADSYEDDFETAVRDYIVCTGNTADRTNRPELNKRLRDRAMGNGWSEPKIVAFRAYMERKHNIGIMKSNGTYFFTGCHRKGEKAANPLTIVQPVDNTAATDEDVACPF